MQRSSLPPFALSSLLLLPFLSCGSPKSSEDTASDGSEGNSDDDDDSNADDDDDDDSNADDDDDDDDDSNADDDDDSNADDDDDDDDDDDNIVMSTTGGTSTTTNPSTSGAEEGATGSCAFEIDASISPAIATVGIVTWSAGSASVANAHIEFGLDTQYGLNAPVDLAEPNYRTLLLGMKPARDYHARIVAEIDGETCTSDDFTVTTGPVPNDIARPEITTHDAAAISPGYTLAGFWGQSMGPGFILDADRDFVWWAPFPQDVMRVLMSVDRKSIWMRNTAQLDGTGIIHRVSLDGLEVDEFSVPTSTHDFTLLPDGTLGLIEHTSGCDQISIFDPETEISTPIFNGVDAHGQTDCHVNAINYYEPDDAFIFSDWAQSSYIKVTRSGELVWVLNGQASDFTGSSWEHQHNLHALSSNRFIVFINGAGAPDPTVVAEYTIDEQAMTTTEVWRYDTGPITPFGGDVQRLENGNTMISFSVNGVIHELNPSGELIQEMTWPIGNTIGYIMHRPSLYEGDPPKMYAFEN